MLGRLKFDIQPLVNEMLDQLPSTVWESETTTFFDPALGGGQFVAEIERRLRAHGHSEANISQRVFGAEERKMHLNFAIQKHILKGKYVVGGVDLDTEEAFGVKKFDVIVGNPPFQDNESQSTNTKQLYVDFTYKAFELTKCHLLFIIPSRWASNESSGLRKTLFNSNHLKGLKYLQNPFASSGVKVNTCMIHVDKTDLHQHTKVTDALNNTQNIELSNTKRLYLKNLRTVDILNKVAGYSKMSSRWNRGGLKRNEAATRVVNSGGYTFIEAVGHAGQSYATCKISSLEDTKGYDQYKVCVNNMGTANGLSQVKIADKYHVGGHSVVFLYTSSNSESEKLVQYLNTKLVRFIIMFTKPSTPNSKATFANIPEIDFTHQISDEYVYEYFGLTQEEINLIEDFVV
jgi:site-specific DNA-methyltransferase (adenine-specific)